MKIGILTFHSQLNYGGILQCWALQTALKKMGHDVFVLDRWWDAENSLLENGYDTKRLMFWLKFVIRGAMGLGDVQHYRRVKRTKLFLSEYLNLSPYHFVDWGTFKSKEDVDVIVVGSDQVWHCGDYCDPSPYLLIGAPNIPAISYAASFGMPNLPEWMDTLRGHEDAALVYKEGLSRFHAISCREKEGVQICSELGFNADYVLDPTQLLDQKEWLASFNVELPAHELNLRTLVCYFLSEDLYVALPVLNEFAIRNNWRVKVFLNSDFRLPVPSSHRRIKGWFSSLRWRCSPRIKIMLSAGPKEFLTTIATADYVLSDSFHALMFSVVFERNVRIISPSIRMRSNMFSRIREISEHVRGRLVVDSVREALESFENEVRIDIDKAWFEDRKQHSIKYLVHALNNCLVAK